MDRIWSRLGTFFGIELVGTDGERKLASGRPKDSIEEILVSSLFNINRSGLGFGVARLPDGGCVPSVMVTSICSSLGATRVGPSGRGGRWRKLAIASANALARRSWTLSDSSVRSTVFLATDFFDGERGSKNFCRAREIVSDSA